MRKERRDSQQDPRCHFHSLFGEGGDVHILDPSYAKIQIPGHRLGE